MILDIFIMIDWYLFLLFLYSFIPCELMCTRLHTFRNLIESWRHLFTTNPRILALRKRVKVRVELSEISKVNSLTQTSIAQHESYIKYLNIGTYFMHCRGKSRCNLTQCYRPSHLEKYTMSLIPTMPDVYLSKELVDVNYFVCTLGQASALNAEKPHLFKTINDFIDLQARQYPTRPAVGFPIPPKDKETSKEWDFVTYSK